MLKKNLDNDEINPKFYGLNYHFPNLKVLKWIGLTASDIKRFMPCLLEGNSYKFKSLHFKLEGTNFYQSFLVFFQKFNPLTLEKLVLEFGQTFRIAEMH